MIFTQQRSTAFSGGLVRVTSSNANGRTQPAALSRGDGRIDADHHAGRVTRSSVRL